MKKSLKKSASKLNLKKLSAKDMKEIKGGGQLKSIVNFTNSVAIRLPI